MKKFAALLLAGAILAGCAAGAAAGTSSDPLVTLRYLTNTFLPGLQKQAADRAGQALSGAYQAALQTLDARAPAAPAGTGQNPSGSSSLSGPGQLPSDDSSLSGPGQLPSGGGSAPSASGLFDRRVKRGDVLTLPAGTSVLLLAGSASVTYTGGAVVDLTAGQVLPSGSALELRHTCLSAEHTAAVVSISSDTAVVAAEGPYTLSPSAETDYNALAGALNEMGMFRGGDLAYGSGYELERAPTRIEGLIMFLRLLGEEGEALAYTGPCPFSDVPAWCRHYVAYAYALGYTRGIGTDSAGQPLFGLENTISAGEYVTFVLRALGYRDSGDAPDFTWDTALSAGQTAGLLNSREFQLLASRPFLRAQVAYLSYFSLSAPMKGGGTLLDTLAARGSVDRTAVRAVMAETAVERIQ